MNTQDPYEQGKACFDEHGETSKDQNPYVPRTLAYEAWNRGWEDAEYRWWQYFHAYGRGFG